MKLNTIAKSIVRRSSSFLRRMLSKRNKRQSNSDSQDHSIESSHTSDVEKDSIYESNGNSVHRIEPFCVFYLIQEPNEDDLPQTRGKSTSILSLYWNSDSFDGEEIWEGYDPSYKEDSLMDHQMSTIEVTFSNPKLKKPTVTYISKQDHMRISICSTVSESDPGWI